MLAKLSNAQATALKALDKAYEVRDNSVKGFLVRVQPTGKKTYYYAYRNAQGQKNRFRIGTHGTITADQARDKAKKLAGEVANDVDIQKAKVVEKKTAELKRYRTLKSFLDNHYEKWILKTKKSGKESMTVLNKVFAEWHSLPLEEINQLLVEKWRADRKKDTKATSINRYIAELRVLLARAVEWGIIEQHPLAKLKPLKNDGKLIVRYLTKEETDKFFAALNQREEEIKAARISANKYRADRDYELYPEIPVDGFADHLMPMIIISLNTGLRRGELFNLKWSDINFQKKILTVRPESAKSGKTRHVPLNEAALTAIKKWQKYNNQNELIFANFSGERFDNVKKAWQNLIGEKKTNLKISVGMIYVMTLRLNWLWLALI